MERLVILQEKNHNKVINLLVDLDNLLTGKISKDPIFSVNSNTTTRELYQIFKDSLIFKPYPINDNGIIETEVQKQLYF